MPAARLYSPLLHGSLLCPFSDLSSPCHDHTIWSTLCLSSAPQHLVCMGEIRFFGSISCRKQDSLSPQYARRYRFSCVTREYRTALKQILIPFMQRRWKHLRCSDPRCAPPFSMPRHKKTDRLRLDRRVYDLLSAFLLPAAHKRASDEAKSQCPPILSSSLR